MRVTRVSTGPKRARNPATDTSERHLFGNLACRSVQPSLQWRIPRHPTGPAVAALRRTTLRQVSAHQPLAGVGRMPQLLPSVGRWCALLGAAAALAACADSA